jgi:Uri superfamily endonuclease
MAKIFAVYSNSRMNGGVYNLIIKLSKSKEIRIGRLGTFIFPRGFYVYTGSAQNGLGKRIDRHFSNWKKLHWHIDYFLSHAKIVKVLRHIGDRNAECKLSRLIGRYDDADVIVNRFGSSDCNCVTHLYYFKNMPGIKDLNLHST